MTSENWNCRPRMETQRETPPDAAADDERESQQPEADGIDRPGEGAQPVVVGGRGSHEDDGRQEEPDEPAREERPRLERVDGAVREGHEQPDDGEREREDGQLEVEAVPATLAIAGRQRADAGRLEAQQAHRLSPAVEVGALEDPALAQVDRAGRSGAAGSTSTISVAALPAVRVSCT